MNLYKDKQSGVYKAHVRTIEGKRRTITTKQTNLEDARKVVRDSRLRELEMAAQSGCLTNQVIGLILAGKKMTVAKAIEEWQAWLRNIGRSPSTIANYTTYLMAWASSADVLSMPPSAVTEQHISDWINSNTDTSKLSSRTVKLATVRSFFDYCSSQKGYSVGNPSRLVRITMNTLSHAQKERRQRIPLNDQEVQALLGSTEGFWHVAITIGRWSGLRLGDIARLEWACFDKPGHMIVWTDKRDRRIEIPVHPEISAVITTLPRLHGQILFPEQHAMISNPKTRSILSTQFGRICKMVGVKDHSFHDLRSTYCSDMDRQGVPIEHIARAVGHRTWDPYKVTRGYIKEC